MLHSIPSIVKQAEWCNPSTHRRWWQENQKLKGSFCYIENLRLCWDMWKRGKKKKKEGRKKERKGKGKKISFLTKGRPDVALDHSDSHCGSQGIYLPLHSSHPKHLWVMELSLLIHMALIFLFVKVYHLVMFKIRPIALHPSTPTSVQL